MIISVLILFTGTGFDFLQPGEASEEETVNEEVNLPQARKQESELGELIYGRRSVRNFEDKEVPRQKVSDILWSTDGITVDGVTGPTRATPSAGATDPLVVYLAASQVENLQDGIYRYNIQQEELEMIVEGDRLSELAQAGLGQGAIREAPFSLIITANFARTTSRYGDSGNRYVKIEAGHAAQNANLMAENLGLSGVIIGAFNDEEVQKAMGGIGEDPLLIIPMGY